MQKKAYKVLFVVTVLIVIGFVIAIFSLVISGSKTGVSSGLELGQNMVVGIPGPELTGSIISILHEIKPGGIVLYRRNYQSNEQFKRLINDLQVISKQDTGVPYFIMVDEEPNGASRLDLLTKSFVLGMPDWKRISDGIAKMADLGITVDLAPVTDFAFNKDSFIGDRVSTKNPTDLKAFNKTFIKLLTDHKIVATLKHFPGAGVFVQDPHKTIVDGYVQESFFDQSLSIFGDGIESGAQFVMTNHAIYNNVDPLNPATLSAQILTGLLRQKLGFKGIIITDDIEDMLAPVYHIDPADAGVRALRAGNTMIMYVQSLEPTLNTFKKIRSKIEADKELKRIVQENYQLIMNFKNK